MYLDNTSLECYEFVGVGCFDIVDGDCRENVMESSMYNDRLWIANNGTSSSSISGIVLGRMSCSISRTIGLYSHRRRSSSECDQGQCNRRVDSTKCMLRLMIYMMTKITQTMIERLCFLEEGCMVNCYNLTPMRNEWSHDG